jgi:surfeit locus 1 family protein
MPGYHLHMPLETAEGRLVFVNLGFVPDEWRTRHDLAAALPETAEVIGLIRHAGQAGWFTPANDTAHNLWYWRDLAGMTAATVPGRWAAIVPFFIDRQVSGQLPSQTYPRAGVTRIDLPNRHLEYALTWYGLALGLIGVYFTFAWPILRGTKAESPAERTG